jgi:hypothetical protein
MKHQLFLMLKDEAGNTGKLSPVQKVIDYIQTEFSMINEITDIQFSD